MRIFCIIYFIIFSAGCSFVGKQSQPVSPPINATQHQRWGSLNQYLRSLVKTNSNVNAPENAAAINGLPKTDLSEKATKLQIGMTKNQAIQLLGEPTWAQSYTGVPLDWTWRNGKCSPVDVIFDEKMTVSGYDEGMVVCSADDSDYTELPDDSFSCLNPDNKSLCSADQTSADEVGVGDSNEKTIIITH